MPKFAQYFASVSGGKVKSISTTYLPHELLPNQIMLTEKEYMLLHVVASLEEAKSLLASVEYKIGDMEK